jgi:hypothetical protein
MTLLRNAALSYGADGLPVFPLIVGGKTPAIAGGFHSASTDAEIIRRMWRIGDRNIGIPTGAASGFWVVDLDPPDGEDGLGFLQAQHGELPATRTARTPRGGFHLWFRYTEPIPSTASRIARHVDVRADLGYVAVPPSITAAGAYTWCGDPTAELAMAPHWLVELARKRPSISERAVAGINHGYPGAAGSNPGDRSSHRRGGASSYGRAALERECAALASTFSGGRNRALNLITFRLFQLVAGGELPEVGVVDRLIAACHANGLIEDDGLATVNKTIASARAAGLKNPRSRNGGGR